MEISRLRVADEDFLVASMIERCPKVMMLRELVKNALEAAQKAPAGERRVEISPQSVEGARKLCIWNTGPGLDRDELFRMCDIASSIGKQNSLEANFGMGAKVASLPSNRHGIRYRSCRDGRVHQVVMGKRDGFYGRIRQPIADGTLADVIDVTEQAAADGRPLGHDWTEVVLLGNRRDQDTVADPYDGSPRVGATWVEDELYGRFFTVPDGLSIVLGEGVHPGGALEFVPLERRMTADSERCDTVQGDRGVVFHYIFDAPDPDRAGQTLSARVPPHPIRPGAGLLFKGELYDLRRDQNWAHEAPIYGFPFGARNFTILIALPDEFPVLPDAYRQFLRYRENAQHQVASRNFAAEVSRRRPEWVLELLRRMAPDAQSAEGARDEMSALFARLGIRRRWWPPKPDKKAEPPKDEAPKDDEKKDEKSKDDEAKKPEDKAKEKAKPEPKIEYEVAPQIVALRDPLDIRERGLENKAARFYPETHQIFINCNYVGVEKLRAQFEAEYANRGDPEKLREAAFVTAEQMVTSLVCRRLVFGLGKREEWAHWEVDQATSPTSLTLAADDTDWAMAAAREEMERRLGPPAGQPRFADAMELLKGAGEGENHPGAREPVGTDVR